MHAIGNQVLPMATIRSRGCAYMRIPFAMCSEGQCNQYAGLDRP
ncbi:hypothetical protein BIFGAL_02591 [Bifidobacterium gallicum DSM 20093 = LMG 11596]|uniref:Uncharacterized protein n=1 Tax=Bifidobacterium gallicum DSM 20093 = LMG 11596 TaxID=561180 RepID=D1NS37_9BIFI|nr:hypothetical protein BIFGAL_02591 [Bifidobacterium gallicum DSM 20093 = LMG 11596]